MSIDHDFYIDTAASRHELRDALVQAGIGFSARPDLDYLSKAVTEATNVTILDHKGYAGRLDNGVVATRRISFGDRKVYLEDPDHPEDFESQTIQGVVALLRAFPEADAYWTAYDARRPVLLRRGGRLVLAQALDENNDFWGAKGSPERTLVDLPYTVEPLGPWDYVGDDQEFWDRLEAFSRAQQAR